MANNNNQYLYGCTIPYDTMRWVATAERHIKKDIGYPFLISFNAKDEEIKNILKGLNYIRLDSRTIDCKSQSNCSNIVQKLIKNNKHNLDLGAFQTCYRYFKYKDINEYFNLKDSYRNTCKILESYVAKYGYSWEVIAMYHNRKDKYKKRWLGLISNYYTKEEQQ